MAFAFTSKLQSRLIRSPGNKQLGGIMDLFKSVTPPVQQTVPPNPNIPTGVAQPGQPLPGTQSSEVTSPNGVVPVQDPNANPGNPGNSESPLANFKDIWNTPATDPNANQSLFANLDPQKLMESARKVNFSQVITSDALTKIQAGGPEAMQALAESMNLVAQQVYAQSALATTKIVEQALTKSNEARDAQLPTLVKKFSANESILAKNPLLTNPAVQPIVGALQEQMIRKNPNATSAEIQQQVNDYLTQFATMFAPKPVEAKSTGNNSDTDWDKFMS